MHGGKKRRPRKKKKKRTTAGEVAHAARSADARHGCKRGHYTRMREVKRFTTPVACGLGQ